MKLIESNYCTRSCRGFSAADFLLVVAGLWILTIYGELDYSEHWSTYLLRFNEGFSFTGILGPLIGQRKFYLISISVSWFMESCVYRVTRFIEVSRSIS